MNDSVIAALEQYISAKILKQPGRHIDPEAPLISSGLVDSFSLVDLALFVEDSFGVHIEDTELNAESFDSLRQLAALIEARQAR
jgi:acyl carrier protein